jgi:putative hydrolase of the HAD superfamily
MDVVGERINEYMAQRLGMDEATIRTLRSRYWEQYGTTMRGLLLEHRINADDYLDYVHGFSVRELLASNAELDRVLEQLPWRKVIFTSSTREHTQQVLEALAIAQRFARTFDIRDTGYVCKPNPAAYQVVLQALGLQAEQCLLVDDSLPNLQAAARLGMVTVWVGSRERADGVTWAIDRIECIADLARAQGTPYPLLGEGKQRRRREEEPCLTK